MPTLPHNFERFLSANEPPVLVAGAGLSWGLVPLPGPLLKQRKELADEELQSKYGVAPIDVDLADDMALFIWAEAVIDALATIAPGEEKRIVARPLGLTSEDCWTAKVGIELRGTTPRHRVIARFAREQMWKSIWSINWDTILESALEQVGLERDKGPSDQGWPTAFATNLLSADLAVHSPNHIIEICKPHGCVHGLATAEQLFLAGEPEMARSICRRLMIGKTELETVRENEDDNAFFARFRDHVLSSPLVAVGWSASEPSLNKVVKESVTPKPETNKVAELTIIDPECNDKGHAEMLVAYGLDAEQVHCKVSSPDAELTTDQLFLWLQVRFALLNIEKRVCAEWKGAIDALLVSTSDGVLPDYLIRFADDFLPAWVRLCWRSGIVELPPGIDPESFDLEKQDQHIPLRGAETIRDDLRSAASVLVSLQGLGDQWDLAKFPGCFWDAGSQHLVIPIPAWAEPGKANDLRALKVLFSRLQHEVGNVSTASIMPIKRSPVDPVTKDWGAHYTTIVSQFFRVPSLADSSNWTVWDDLTAGERVAA